MKTELFTVSKIFTENLLRIPDYQRGFSWEGDQLKDFWSDIEQLGVKDNHYTGVLTFESVPEAIWKKWDDDIWIIESRKYKPYYIVDGQQRISTVIILLQAIVESVKDGSLNFTPVKDIRRKYIFDSKVEEAARSYIFGYEKDNPSYEYLKTKIFMENSGIHLPDEVTIYTKNLLAAKKYFEGKLSEMSREQLEQLFTKVTQQLVFNVYEISTDIDVFVAFETMNNRGKPLSTLELLKNRLIFLSTKLKLPSGKDGNLRRKINDAWKSAYHYLGKNELRLLNDDKFLGTFLCYYYLKSISLLPDRADYNEKNIYYRRYHIRMEELNRFLLNMLFTPKRLYESNEIDQELPKLTRELISDFSANLKNCVELYYKLSTPSESNYSEDEKIQLERINRLVGHNPPPMLMAIYLNENNSEKRIKLLAKFERLLFCQSFGMRATNFLRHNRGYNFDQYTNYVSGKITTDDLTALFDNIVTELIKETPLSEAISDWVKNGDGYYGWKTIRYFMFEYELHLQSKTKSSRSKLLWNEFANESYEQDYVTVEHIYPQKAKSKYWTDHFSSYTSIQKRALRNSLGNLLPLSVARNASLGNNSFPDKKNGITVESLVGYKYGCFSEIEVSENEG